MSIVAWDVRGLGNRDIVRALKDVISKLYGSFYVDPQGLASGLALWWIADVQIGVIRESSNFIDVSVSVTGEEGWFFTFIYGLPYREEKHQFWKNLSSLGNDHFSRWCVLGDTNIISNQSEKEGGNSVDNSQIGWFYEFLDSTRLLDLPIKGGTFTWSNMRCDDEAIVEKLDRILISNEWSLKFPKAIEILEAAIASDHNPIVLLLEGLKKEGKKSLNLNHDGSLKMIALLKLERLGTIRFLVPAQMSLLRSLRPLDLE
ncbi:hypothetical protein V6N11_058697 [Hibiscus sabdariffa]|uniref:Endonuclease/exonuclease/phosphatase domain-containing protein n=1 Tax=Hibiscus sabdariffa TaxID=183260 RepID=A0ABR2U510_9ROSI